MANWFKEIGQNVWSNTVSSWYEEGNAITNASNVFDLFSSGNINQNLQTYGSVAKLFGGLTTSVPKSIKDETELMTAGETFEQSMASVANPYPVNNENRVIKKTAFEIQNADILGFKIPDWSYADFINERAIFQKSLSSPTTEPAWFYFKVFFNFDTQYGLLGGLLCDEDYKYATNSAAKYLAYSHQLYAQERPNDRIEALHKFASILSYINTNTPWFFKSVRGLNNVQTPLLNEFSKEKSIELECDVDAIDMRLSTLMDLYKFAVYDDINCKEIIPENLRKFDMNVILFQTPLRYYHTAMNSLTKGKFNYKSLNPKNGVDYSNVMSFKMYTFVNCEIAPESLGAMVPSDVTNETPFQMGKGTIKITYDRVYQHTMNEFTGMLFGSDGFYYNTFSLWANKDATVTRNSYFAQSQIDRYNALQNTLDNYMMNKNSPAHYKELVDASEAICNHNLMTMGGNALGNIYGGQTDLQFNHFDKNNQYKSSPNDQLGEQYKTDFYKYKLKRIKDFVSASRGENISTLTKIGASYLLGLIGASYDVMSSKLIVKDHGEDGFLPGYGNTGIRRRMRTGSASYDIQMSNYYKAKLRALKSGFVHNFSELPQNQIQNYLNNTFDKHDVWSEALLTDNEIRQSLRDTNSQYIMGAQDTGIQRIGNSGTSADYNYSKYYKDKLAALKNGFIANIGTLPQNHMRTYMSENDKFDVWSDASASDSTLTKELKNENITHIAGAKETEQIKHFSDNKTGKRELYTNQIITEYLKTKLNKLKS